MSIKPFMAKAGGSITVANATSASALAELDPDCEQIVLTNTSATAIAYFRCDNLADRSATPPQSTVATGFPVLPASQIRVTVGMGWKKFSVIASEADGSLILSPGQGD